jgi:hypothetical protein
MSYHSHEGGTGYPVRLQTIDSNPLVRLTTREGDSFYVAANEIVAVYPFTVIMAPACKGDEVVGSKVSLKGSDGDTFWVCTEPPSTVYNRVSLAQRRV